MARTMSISVSIPEEDYEEIRMFAEHEGESISDVILNSIREQLELWEDIRDIKARENEPTSTLEEVMERLGLTTDNQIKATQKG